MGDGQASLNVSRFRLRGLELKRDHIVYDFERLSLLQKIQGLRQHNPDTLDEYFNSTPMNPAATAIRQPVDENLLSLAGYRPLDRRWHYRSAKFNDRLRTRL